MAIGVAEAVAEIVNTSNVSTFDFGSFTPTADHILVCLALVRGSVGAGTIVNVSGTALQWTRKGSATFNAGADTAYCYWAKVPASPAASVYRVDCAGDAGTGCIAYLFSFSGADLVTIDPIKQFKTGSGTSTDPRVTLDAAMGTLNGYCAAWMGALSSTNPANVSAPPTSWTEVGDNGLATPTSNATGAFRAGGETGTGVTFTAASTTWGMIACEVYVAGAGPAFRTPGIVGHTRYRMR
jgi:hypothetical protein